MFRTAAFLALVLSHVAPHFGPRAEAAVLLSELGRRRHVDPLLIIADAKHESDWDPAAENRSSGTLGLTQIRPENFLPCRENREGAACAEVKRSLVDWRFNLTVIAADFALARAYCEEHEHTSLAIYWLQIPRGDDAVRRSRCGHRHGRALIVPKAVRELLAKRAELERLQ